MRNLVGVLLVIVILCTGCKNISMPENSSRLTEDDLSSSVSQFSDISGSSSNEIKKILDHEMFRLIVSGTGGENYYFTLSADQRLSVSYFETYTYFMNAFSDDAHNFTASQHFCILSDEEYGHVMELITHYEDYPTNLTTGGGKDCWNIGVLTHSSQYYTSYEEECTLEDIDNTTSSPDARRILGSILVDQLIQYSPISIVLEDMGQ